MHLIVDAQPLQTGSRRRGIGRYTRSLIRAMAGVRPDWRIEAVRSAHLPPWDDAELPGVRPLDFTPPVRPADTAGRRLAACWYGDWLAAAGPSAVLLTGPFDGEAVHPDFVGPRPALHALVYDLIPLLFADAYLPAAGARNWYGLRLRALAGCDGLLAISAHTAADVVDLLPVAPARVVNIRGAADPSFGASAEADRGEAEKIRRAFGLGRDFVLYVGGEDHRKNLAGAVAGFAALPPAVRLGLDLVITCGLSPQTAADLQAMAAGLGVAGSLKFTGYVSDAQLRALYRQCRVFFFPSLYEGLGLPVLEALACGAPVVTAANSSLPEFAGPTSWTADPESPPDMARALSEALAEPPDLRRAERIAFAGSFTWEDAAERACRAIERRRPPAVRPRRVAWVVPAFADAESAWWALPPGRFDLDPFSDARGDLAPDGRPAAPLSAAAAEPPDLVVYRATEVRWNERLRTLARRRPGLLVVGDGEWSALGDGGSAAWCVRAAEAVAVCSEASARRATELGAREVALIRSPGGSADPRPALRPLADLMDRLLDDRRAGDRPWAEGAAEALSVLPDRSAAERLAESWAELRLSVPR